MKESVHQGDVIKVERIKAPVLVASKDFFNESGEVIGCPILDKSSESPILQMRYRQFSTIYN